MTRRRWGNSYRRRETRRSRQMARHLRRNGWCVGRHRVRRLMLKMGLAQRYPTRVINFIQTRILITHHSCCRAGCRNSHERRSLFRLRYAIEEGFLATKAKIRAVAKALCFRACTDCKSADECDPDKNWIEEALAILERPGPGQIGQCYKVAFDTRCASLVTSDCR
jgi:hypothetical protein